MIPKAKKNLHECEYHLGNMKSSSHMEDFEISYAAFVNSARNVTFVLQKEYAENPDFLNWYGNSKDYENGSWVGIGNEKTNTKIYEMISDDICKYFTKLRSQIVKEGANSLFCSTHISSLNTTTDLINPPSNSSLEIGSNGMYYRVHEGTPQEDRIPARTRGVITTKIFIQNPPKNHLREEIPSNQQDVISLSEKYYRYLKSIVEDWTGVINRKSNPQ